MDRSQRGSGPSAGRLVVARLHWSSDMRRNVVAAIPPLNAVVKNGRLTLDEPVDLPEGQVLERVPADPYSLLDDTDELDDDERSMRDASIESAWRDYRAGGVTHSAEEVLGRLREKE
jgi:hypothetical protein